MRHSQFLFVYLTQEETTELQNEESPALEDFWSNKELLSRNTSTQFIQNWRCSTYILNIRIQSSLYVRETFNVLYYWIINKHIYCLAPFQHSYSVCAVWKCVSFLFYKNFVHQILNFSKLWFSQILLLIISTVYSVYAIYIQDLEKGKFGSESIPRG